MPLLNYELLSDEELLSLIRDNNTLAFKALFNRYYRPLCKFISIYIADEALAEEIISDVFVSLWGMHNKSAVRNLKNYLFIAARNHSFNRLRKKTAPLTYSDTLEDYDNSLSDGTSPLSLIHSRETQQEIIQLIDELPLRQREVLLMSRISGVENEEIASVLGISVKTVQSTLYQAVRELRSKLSQAERS
ncbi:MAG: RNA polymerase sigma-70 factor [Sphingobacteriales bacterium]|nr:MAG: RNA polymerase sigma-70 factor [Sphingobacteriales bacterium]